MNEPAASNVVALPAAKPSFDLSPQNFEQALTFSGYLASSDLVPKDFKGKPDNCLIAMQWGAEIGLKPLQALQNLAIINGRPALWGDAVIALVRGSGVCEYVIESQTEAMATCKVKRRGEPEQIRTFSMADATKAGLINKQGPWSQYPKRMMQMRARAFALRDVFPDVLRGLPVAEEVMDMPKDMGATEPGTAPGAPDPLLKTAEEAAGKGVAAYQEFWGKATKDDRKALAAHHDRLKDVATEADTKRTVDNEPPKVTAGQVSVAMDKAQTLDDLYAAAALIDTIDDAAIREELDAEFAGHKTRLGGDES